MRVLQLGPYPPPHGGVQTNLAAIRDLLLQNNDYCAVINITRHRKAETDEIYYPETAIELVRLLWTLRYDIVHLHMGGNVTSRLLGLAFVCCSMPGSRSVLTFHSGGYPSSPAGQRARPRSIQGIVFRRFDRIIAVNQQIVDFFLKLGVSQEKISIIHPHPIPSIDKNTPPLRRDLRSFYSSHHPVLISVGLLEAEYDLPLQIEALGRLRKRFTDAGLVLIGSGSLEGELRQLISSQTFHEHILLCGDVARGATLWAIAQSDVMLRTTLYDGDAVSVREALHLRTPVVATDNAMRPKGVHLIPVHQLDTLVSTVETLLEQPAKSEPQSSCGGDNIQAVLDLYIELLSSRN